jgi:hypothetical protein
MWLLAMQRLLELESILARGTPLTLFMWFLALQRLLELESILARGTPLSSISGWRHRSTDWSLKHSARGNPLAHVVPGTAGA